MGLLIFSPPAAQVKGVQADHGLQAHEIVGRAEHRGFEQALRLFALGTLKARLATPDIAGHLAEAPRNRDVAHLALHHGFADLRQRRYHALLIRLQLAGLLHHHRPQQHREDEAG